ncbi:O-antigen ligase family protein [Flavobacterium anhuiense]|uniref:O-antigen ligase family protein n=1 Tax=Flavobacterium anhuiense TaxID=459526 RepID=UPI003D990B1F
MREIQADLKKYGMLYVLIFLHLFGGVIADFAIIVSSFYAFFYFSLKKEIDLYVVFLLLYTNICMGQNSDAENVSNINVGIYALFKNVLIIGPIALSTKFAFALAVPVRALLNFAKTKPYWLVGIWFLTVLFSIIGLFISFFSGAENKAGLTVGFRIVLTMGVVLLPQLVSSKERFLKQFDKIFILSAVSLSLGLMNAHWLFITFGFLPYLWFRFKSFPLKFVLLLCLGRTLIGLETTITIVAMIVLSFIFLIFAKVDIFNKKKLKYLGPLFILIPILITIYVVRMPVDKLGYDFTSVMGYVKFKLIGDRKPIWDASFLQISSQNFFIAPAGSSLEVYFDYIDKWTEWSEGSHNIFLEIGRQTSYFSMLFYAGLIYKTMYYAYKNLTDKVDCYILLSFTSIYLAFGLSGQHIVYDGVGFMFWLFIAQFSKIKIRKNENITCLGG